MDVAKEHLSEVSSEQPLIVLAREQDKGRGRLGSVWAQPESGLYATFAFKSPAQVNSLSGLSLVCGCVLREVFNNLGCETFLKWPNDLLSGDGRKISGVLIELAGQGDKTNVLIGIGVNLSGAPAGVSRTTSIQDLSGQSVTPVDLAARIAPLLWFAWNKFLTGGFELFREQWLGAAWRIGTQIEIDTGSERISGIFEDVRPDGALLVRTSAGVLEPVVAGHVLPSHLDFERVLK